MDVGDPSNMERLRALVGEDAAGKVGAGSGARLPVDDETIRATIRE